MRAKGVCIVSRSEALTPLFRDACWHWALRGMIGDYGGERKGKKGRGKRSVRGCERNETVCCRPAGRRYGRLFLGA
jgi:hypothetical protein